MDIHGYLSGLRLEVDARLDRLLPPANAEPRTIHKAMRHSVFAGGKRLRPILVVAAGESVGGSRDTLLHIGAAVEMLHTYSLIHDDLPALDNDDLRRGHPTCHKVFGEAMAILAGDALQAWAYRVLADVPGVDDRTRLEIVREVAAATGTVDGMIGGQVLDLESEGRTVALDTLNQIHRSKTGALLAACTRCGGISAGATAGELAALTEFGSKAGLAFQIIDDILDLTASSNELGKTAGKDQKVKKATYPSLFGLEASRERARELVDEAISALVGFGGRAEPLRALAEFIFRRTT